MLKLNCEQARELLHDRIDGDLAAVDGQRLDAHLSRCEACRRWAREMGRVQAALGELREASRHFGEAAERPSGGRRRASRGWRPMRIAAALLLGAGATLGAWRLMWAGGGGAVSDRSFPGAQLAQKGLVEDRPAGDLAQQRPVGNRSAGEMDGGRRSMVRVTLVGEEADRHFAVPGDSDKPNVHFFRIYRAYGDRVDATTPGTASETTSEPVNGA